MLAASNTMLGKMLELAIYGKSMPDSGDSWCLFRRDVGSAAWDRAIKRLWSAGVALRNRLHEPNPVATLP